MKGKKFNAAEKHFLGKEEKYRKEISNLKKVIESKNREITAYENIIAELEGENSQQKDWIERLLQYTELSLDDIKEACEKDKSVASAIKFFGMFERGGFDSYL